MMVKASTEYYNLEKVAEVLSVSTAEVNRLREQSKLRGFRDGANWKFLKEDVHSYLAESIKARNAGAGGIGTSGDSGFDLAGGSASASSFDLLMEEAALPDDSDLVSVAPARPKSDLDLAALDPDDELSLAEETQISSLVVPKKTNKTEEPSSKISLAKERDSSALVLASSTGASDVDLNDEMSVLGAGGSSPQLGLAGDSGFDMLVAGEDENIFEVDEKSDIVAASLEEENMFEVDEKTDVADAEFKLEPSPAGLDDNSESSSQVIAIDVGLAGGGADADSFGTDFGDFAGFDSGLQQGPPPVANDPFGTAGASFDTAAPVVSVMPKKPAASTEEYSTGMLVALVCAFVVMLPAGLMLLDTMLHIWSWDDPYILKSGLMEPIANWIGR